MEITDRPLCEILFGERLPRSVAVIGSGGKTSTIERLAREYLERGRTVIVTPTTKMCPPEDRTLLASNAEDALDIAKNRGLAYIGCEVAPGKMRGLPPEARFRLFVPGVAVLSEADGSRTLPMKATADYEPVIPDDADAVVLLFGLDSIGRPLGEVCHRPEIAERILGASRAKPVTPLDAARVLRASYFERFPELKMTVMLNKCDDGARDKAASELEALLGGARCVRTRLF